MMSREILLDSIQPKMRLTKNFFMQIYGYELTWPGFAEQALSRLEKAGCSSVRAYYRRFTSEYECKHEEEMKNVAQWLKGNKRKGSGDLRKKEQEAEQPKKRGLPEEYVANRILKW